MCWDGMGWDRTYMIHFPMVKEYFRILDQSINGVASHKYWNQRRYWINLLKGKEAQPPSTSMNMQGLIHEP